MKVLKSFLFSQNSEIQKKSIFWNMVASLLNAIISAYLLMIVTRFIGIEEAGIFAIASTIGYQLLTIGNFGMRNYQATDTRGEYSFKEYETSRWITCFGMVISSIIIVLVRHYEFEKAIVVICFSLFKMVDAIEDVYHGEYQRQGRLDVACKAQSIRYIISLLIFTFFIIFTKSMVYSCLLSTIFSYIVFLIINESILTEFKLSNTRVFNKVKKLLIECLPLFLSTYLYLYICNSPKYSIDLIGTNEMQTYFGIIFMPVFVINLLSGLIYRPMLTSLSSQYNSGLYKKFISGIKKQILIILGLTICAVIGAYFLGIPILEIIYGVNLNNYRLSLVILMIGGGFNALVGYLLSIVTIIRAQKTILFGYAFDFLCAIIVSDKLVKIYGINGASIMYVCLVFILVLYFIFVFTYFFRKRDVKNG